LEKGHEPEAWPALDRALAFYARIKRPEMPHSRDVFTLRAASYCLTPPVSPVDLEITNRLLNALGPDAPRGPANILKSRLAAAKGKRDDAKRLLTAVDA